MMGKFMKGNASSKGKTRVASFVMVLVLLAGLGSAGSALDADQETLYLAAAVPVWDVSVYIDDVRLQLDDPPRIQDGRTLVPMRHFFEGLGATVSWDGVDRVASGSRDGIEVDIPIGSTQPTVQGQVVPIEIVAQIFEGRTYIPLRFVGEAFGDDVNWDGGRRRIDIYTGQAPDEEADGVVHYSKTFEPRYNLSYPENWRIHEEPGYGVEMEGSDISLLIFDFREGEVFEEHIRLNSKHDVMEIGSLMVQDLASELHEPEMSMMGDYEVVYRKFERTDNGYRGMLIAMERKDGDLHLFYIVSSERGEAVSDKINTVLDSFQPVY